MKLFINAILNRKEFSFETERCKIEKIVKLTEEEYVEFANNMIKDYEFITQNKDKMFRDKQKIAHCILVVGEESKDGILIESEGADYARYSAFVPNINEYIRLKLEKISDAIIKEGTEETSNGNYIFSIKGLAEEHGINIDCLIEDLVNIIREREEVSDVEVIDDDLDIIFYLNYCQNAEEDENINDESEQINVLIVEPNKTPRRATISNEYEEIRDIVGGRIQTYPLAKDAELVCNEEGKLMKLTGNRRVGEEIIAGTFIIVGADGGEEFISLTDKQIEEYEKRFWNPEEHSAEEVQNASRMNIYGM